MYKIYPNWDFLLEKMPSGNPDVMKNSSSESSARNSVSASSLAKAAHAIKARWKCKEFHYQCFHLYVVIEIIITSITYAE
jgi:hypothetical protein